MYLKNRPSFTGGYTQQEEIAQRPTAVKYEQPQVSNEDQGLLRKGAGAVLNTLVGFGKELASAPVKAAKLGSNLGLMAAAAVRPDATYEQLKAAQEGSGMQAATTRPELLTPQGTAQKFGAGIEQVGEFFVPGAVGLKGAKALGATSKIMEARGAGKLASAAIPRLAQIGTEALGAAGVGSLQQGEVNKDVLASAGLQGGFSALGKVPQVALGAAQGLRGAKQIYEGDTQQGLTNLGFGALGIYGGLKSKGLILDKPISELTARPQVSAEPSATAGMKAASIPQAEGNFAQKLGKRIQNVELRPSQADYRSGFNINNVSKYDVAGSVPEVLDKTQKRIAGYMQTVDKIAQEYGDPQVVSYKNALDSVKERYLGQGKSLNQKAYQDAVDRLGYELDLNNPGWREGNLDSFKNGLQTKRLAGIQAAFEHDPIKKLSTPSEDVYNQFYISLKNQLESAAPKEFAEANKAISELIPIQNAALRRIPIETRNNVVSLSDLLGGMSVAIDPKAIPVAILSKVTRNPGAAKLLMSMGKREAPFIPGEIPKKPSYPLLPKGSTINLPGSFADTSGVASQEEAIQNLRAQGYKGPLTQEEMQGLKGSAFKRVNTFNGMTESMFDAQRQQAAKNNALKSFNLPDVNESEAQRAYQVFKTFADRSRKAADQDFDAERLKTAVGGLTYGDIMRPTGGGNLTDDELLQAFKERYVAEKGIKKSNIMVNPPVESVFGLGAGLEPEIDENGKPTGKYKFNPAKAALGFAGMTVAKKLKKVPSIKNTEEVLNTVNPTGSISVEYNPAVRAAMKLGKNMTTLDKNLGESPDKIVTIYRGAPKTQKSIVPGDFITTNRQLAKDYAGTGVVLEKKVKLSDILDVVDEPLGEEYLYRPSN